MNPFLFYYKQCSTQWVSAVPVWYRYHKQVTRKTGGWWGGSFLEMSNRTLDLFSHIKMHFRIFLSHARRKVCSIYLVPWQTRITIRGDFWPFSFLAIPDGIRVQCLACCVGGWWYGGYDCTHRSSSSCTEYIFLTIARALWWFHLLI